MERMHGEAGDIADAAMWWHDKRRGATALRRFVAAL